MIPKIIHYCWFGENSLDSKSKKCIESWKKYFPDYEIKEWNESDFDVNQCEYAKEAYKEKKWAFVSDYARMKILYEYGGIYFDTDVEVIKSFDDILSKGNYMGCEMDCANITVAPGLGMAVTPKLDIIKEIMIDYENSSFYKENGEINLYTVVERTTSILKKHGLKNASNIQTVAELNIYPTEYFCPINLENGKLEITENTHSIHHYSGSWESKTNKLRGKIYRFLNRHFGKNVADFVKGIFGKRAVK